jgi:dihydrofolate reductase
MIPVTLMMAITLDGKIAKNSNHFADWTSLEDKKLFRTISKDFGMFMVGLNTFNTFPGALPGRLNVVFNKEENPPVIENVKWVQGEPEKVLMEMESLGFKKALLAGGTTLNSLFLEKKLISEIIVTVEPKIFGEGLSLFNREIEADLELKEIEKINDNSIMLRYLIKY